MVGENKGLEDIGLCHLIIGVLVSKLGNTIVITQSDIDTMAYNRLEETWHDDTIKLSVAKCGSMRNAN